MLFIAYYQDYLLHAIYVLQQHFNVFTFVLRVQRLSTLYGVILYLLHAIYVLQQLAFQRFSMQLLNFNYIYYIFQLQFHK
jgi:hypothetical protein